MATGGQLYSFWGPPGARGLRTKGWPNTVQNMPEEKTSDYATLDMYILDDIDPEANDAHQGNAAQLSHAQFCNNMRDVFSNTLYDFTVHSVRRPHGETSKQFLKFIAAQLRNKTADSLVVFCYQGKAGGDGTDYHFFPGGRKVNAHKLIVKANESNADCLFLLDCFFPDHTIQQWKREDHMTEIIIAGDRMRDSLNGRTNTGAQSFAEGFADGMRAIRAAPSGQDRQTIPRIMLRNTNVCTKPKRHWLHVPHRLHPERRVWRIFADVGRLKRNEGGQLELRRCEITGRRQGEFGYDPNLDDAGDNGGGDGDGYDDDNNNGDGARREGGGDDDDDGGDGDSSNGGWGRGFGRTRRRAPRTETAEDGNDAGDHDKGIGDSISVAKTWTQLCLQTGFPSNGSDADVRNLVETLKGLPNELKKHQHQLPTPSSSGNRRRPREESPTPADAGAKGRSEAAKRPRRNSPVSPDCEIVTTQRVGHESGNPIDLSGATKTTEGEIPASARRERVKGWLQDFLSPFAEEDDEKALIKRSDSPAPRAGGDDTSASLREASVESDLEITFVGPVNRPFSGRGALIDLTDAPIDLTDELDSLFIPEQINRVGRNKTAGLKKEGQSSLFSLA